jgi:RimJ/RimL family protein N-acetyltransferase
MHYSADYQENMTLDDGSQLILRMVLPSDKAAFVTGLGQLSESSRYQRFMAPKTGFSDSELAFLTEVDGENHLAIVAGLEKPGAEPEGIGVARIVRLEDDPETAEIGITVVDAWQCRGIGRLLLERIVAAGAERGIRRIRAQVMADNSQVMALLKDYIVVGQLETDHGVLSVDFPIPEQNPADVVDKLLELIRAAARDMATTPAFIGSLAARPVDSVVGLASQLTRTVADPLLKQVDRVRAHKQG